MSDDQVFVYGAVYADRADADADYETLVDLHAADLVGSYDVALMYRDDEGKVHVTKHEKPTQHGAWTGAVSRRARRDHLSAGDHRLSDRRRRGRRRDRAMRSAACRAVTPRSSASSSTRAKPRWS